VPQQVISIVGAQLYQPIADLIAHMISRPHQPSDRVSSNHFEGGYAAATILLLAVLIESFVQRDRYFLLQKRSEQKQGSNSKPKGKVDTKVPGYLRQTLRYRRTTHIEELFDVRNAIAHNHVWRIDFLTPSSGGRRHVRSELVEGTHQLRSSIDPKAKIHRTRQLRLNLLPPRLDRMDVLKSLNATVHVLDFIARRGHNRVPLTSTNVRVLGRRIPFRELPMAVSNVL
jgi:hypothetical protein